MNAKRSSLGFTLIELSMVIGVIGLLMVVLLPVLSQGRALARQTKCLNNLRQISFGIEAFHANNDRYPSGDLAGVLLKYLPGKSRSVFVCPEDTTPDVTDSYSDFYCPRWGQQETTARYIASCPRHRVGKSRSVVVLFSLGEGKTVPAMPVRWNGVTIWPGTQAVGGVLEFQDRSRTTILGGHRATLVTSIAMPGGKYYSVIRVEDGHMGTVDCDVTPGSNFEVITPAAVAGVQGTELDVQTYVDAQNKQHARVIVNSGSVRVTGFDGSEELVRAGRQTDKTGPTPGTVGPASPPFTEGPVYLIDAWYYREVYKNQPDFYKLKWHQWNWEEQQTDGSAGYEEWERALPSDPWVKTQDEFSPND